MRKLSAAQHEELKAFLHGQGLTFKPLFNEMLDHMSCELEERIDEGCTFEEAWAQTIDSLPHGHFQLLQNETMETINKRFNLSRVTSYTALGLLFISLLFKTMHFPWSGELLLLSFFCLAASLLAGSLSGIFWNKEKKGTFRVLAVVAGVILLMVGFSFSLLHLPGAPGIVLIAVLVIISSLFINTVYVYRNASGEGNLLTFLHEKYTPGIERFLLILLFPLLINKVVALFTKPTNDIGSLILLVVIFGAGLQLVALGWRTMERDLTKRNVYVLIALTISLCTLTLPFLGANLPFWFRVLLITIYSTVSGWLAYSLENPKRPISFLMVSVVPVLFLGWALLEWGLLNTASTRLVFNLPMVALLLTALLLCRKNEIMRTYMIISLASYLFEYPLS